MARRSSKTARPGNETSVFRLSRVLSRLSAVMVMVASLVGAHWFLDRPIRNLHLEGSFERVTSVDVHAALAAGLKRTLLSVNLSELQTEVEALDWVRSAQVSRRWPDTLVIRVIEHQASALWGDAALLNRDGEIFSVDARHGFPELPRLAGPLNTEGQVAQRYLELQQPLGAVNLHLTALSMDERGSWTLQLQGGQTVRIGRRDVQQRLDRFFRLAAPLLASDLERVSHVDMRYTNGFSVGWHPAPTSVSATAAAGGE